MPHSAASSAPEASSASTYIAWWARWKPPTPMCTIPGKSSVRSYVGIGMSSSASVWLFRAVIGSGFSSERGRDVALGMVGLDVAALALPAGERDVLIGQRLVGHLGQQMGDDVQPRPLLVVADRDVPGRPLG